MSTLPNRILVLSTIAVLSLHAGAAHATIADESGCRSAIAKHVSKLGALALKTEAKCIAVTR